MERAAYSKALVKAFRSTTNLENQLIDAGCPQSLIEELLTEMDHYMTSTVMDPSLELMRWIVSSMNRPVENSQVKEIDDKHATTKPKFDTSVDALNDLTHGGYGLTTLGGDAKTGKTMFAIGTAITAAMQGWRVAYVNAELDWDETLLAVRRYCGGLPNHHVIDRLRFVMPDFTFEPMDLIQRMQNCIQLGDDKLLIVLDSINALVDLSDDGKSHGGLDYWSANALWRNFAVRTVRASLGKVAFLVVSETNKDGGIKGRTLEFKSDLVIRMKTDQTNRNYLNIDVTHSRSTPSADLGSFYRDWKTGRFLDGEAKV